MTQKGLAPILIVLIIAALNTISLYDRTPKWYKFWKLQTQGVTL